MRLEWHQRSTQKYLYVECNYTLFLLGSEQRDLGEELPLFCPPPAHEGYWASPAHFWGQSRDGTGDLDLRPSGELFLLVLAEGSGHPPAAEEFRLGRTSCPNHDPTYLFLSNSRVQEKLSFLQNKKLKKLPWDWKSKFHLLTLRLYLKPILCFRTKCCS